jgi:hypothetical protein
VITGSYGDVFTTKNGSYKLWISSYEDKTLKMLGTGIEVGKNGVDPVQIRMDINGPTKGVSVIVLN